MIMENRSAATSFNPFALLAVCSLLLLAVACGGERRNPAGAIYSTEAFTVWPDSMLVGECSIAPSSFGEAVAGSPVMSGSDTLIAFLFNLPGDTPGLPLNPLVDSRRAEDEALAILDALDEAAENGLSYPVVATRADDLARVADVFAATGSEGLRRPLLDAARGLVDYERDMLFCDSLYLFKGIDRATLSSSAYPAWMNAADMASSLSYANNIAHARLLDLLASELQGADADLYRSMRDSLINSIDTYFWIPDRGRYSRLITGYPRPQAIDDTDLEAQARAVAWGLASPPLVRAMVVSAPVLSDGVPQSWPLTSSSASAGSGATALWCVSASRAANEAALSHALGSMCAMSGGRGIKTALLNGVAGISTRRSDRMAFAPCVPSSLGGEIRIDDLRYRDAVISLSIHGTGNIISTFSLDATAQNEHWIPSTLVGRHTIDITLVGWDNADDFVNIVEPETVSFPERQLMEAADSITVKFTDFAKPYARSLRDKKLARVHVESTRFRNRSLRFEVETPRGGDYFISIRFINGEGIVNPDRLYALRTLSVNGSRGDIVVFPQLTPDRWRYDLDWQSSTGVTPPMRIALRPGVNALSLDYFDPGVAGFNHDANTLIPISATLTPVPAAHATPDFHFRSR